MAGSGRRPRSVCNEISRIERSRVIERREDVVVELDEIPITSGRRVEVHDDIDVRRPVQGRIEPEHVISGAAVQQVVAEPANQRVVAVVADQHVVALVAVEGVRAVVVEQDVGETIAAEWIREG